MGVALGSYERAEGADPGLVDVVEPLEVLEQLARGLPWPATSTLVVLAAPPLGLRNATVRGPSKSRWIAARSRACCFSADPSAR